MSKWIKAVSVFCLSLTLLFLFPFVAPTTVHAGSVLAGEEEPVQPVKLNVQAKSMVKDTTFRLRVYNVTETQKVSYKSSDAEVASISKKGIITASKIGTATITVTVKDSESGTSTTLTCEITVGPPAISIKLTLNEIVLELEKKTSLKAILKPNTTAEIAAFYCLNPEIATVSATGKVTAKAVGEATIIAEIANGKYDVCVVTIVEPPVEKQEEGTDPTEGSSEKPSDASEPSDMSGSNASLKK